MYAYNKNGTYIKNNKFIFNDINLSNEVVVENITRPLLPTILNEGLFIDGKKGKLLKRSIVDNKNIQVNVRILEQNKEEREEVIKQLSASLYSETPKKLELYDTDLYNYALLTSTSDLINENGTRSINFMFECFDPFSYGENKTEILNTDFINNGFDAVGRIECMTDTTELIQVKQRGKVLITINHNIVAGNELVIDLEKQLITLNGNSIMKFVTLDSDFFKIDKGLNNIEVTNVETGYIEYKERWL